MYLALCILSAFWSVDFFTTFFHSSVYLIGFVLAYCAARYSPSETLHIYIVVVLVSVILSWILLVIAPDLALQEKGIWRLRGIYFHEFELGFACSSVLVIYFVMMSARQAGRPYFNLPSPRLVVIVCSITLLATQTRSLIAYTTALVVMSLVVTGSWRTRVIAIFASLMALALVFLFYEDFLSLVRRGESDLTLSGRTLIWERALAVAQDRPKLGHGFGSFDSVLFDPVWLGSYRPAHAHNAWVMSFFELGFAGAFLLSIVMATLLITAAVRARFSIVAQIAFYLAALGVLGSITSLIFGGKISLLSLLPYFLLRQDITAVSSPKT